MKWLSVFLILFVGVQTFSQQYNFRHFSLKEGLAQSQVYAIDQDERGFLWVGTQGGGVDIFDGQSFKNLNRKDHLKNLYINTIKFQKGVGMWIGTDEGLYLFSTDQKLIHSFLENKEINDIEFQHNKCLVATENGSFRISKDNQDYTIQQLTKNKSVQSILYWKGKVLIGSDHQIILFEKNETQKYQVPLVRSLFVINEQLFALTYSNGIYEYSNTGFNLRSDLPHNYGTNESYTTPDGVWIATNRNGAFCLTEDIITQKFNTQTGLPSNSIRAVFQDNKDNLWFGTSGNGLCQYTNDNIYAFSKQHGLSADGIHAVFTTNDQLITSTFDGGIDTFSIQHKTPKQFKSNTGFTDKKAKSFVQIDSNECWIGTDGDGIFSLKDCQFTPLFKDSPKLKWIRALRKDDSTIWIGSLGYGLFKFENNKLTHFRKQPFDRVNDIAILNDHRVALATNMGAFIFSPSSQLFEKIYEKECRSVTICKNTLFLGTKNEGVYFLEKNQLQPLTGTWSDNTYFVRTDNEQQLWVGSEKGVQKFHFDSTFTTPNIVNIGKAMGLVGIETCINAFANDSTNQGVWVGTLEGLSFIKQDIKSQQENSLPLLTIQEMHVFYDPIPNFKKLSKSGLRFYHDQNHLSFKVKGVDLTLADLVRYKWKLEGYDKQWSKPQSSDYITYSKLPFGKYTFQLKASVNGKDWTPMETISFTILRPFWRTYWFYTLVGSLAFICLISVLRIAYILYRRKIAKHQKDLKIQNRLKDLELKTLRLQLNPHFLFNCLNSIKGYIAENQGQEARRQITNFAKLMRQYLDNSSTSWITVAEEIKMLTNYLNLEVMLNDGKVDYHIHHDESTDLAHIPPMIIQPFVENAIHHGLKPLNDKGILDIHFTIKDNILTCTVSDNGIGRKKAKEISERKNHDSKAMKIITERLAYLSQEEKAAYSYRILDLEQGTQIIINFPIPKEL